MVNKRTRQRKRNKSSPLVESSPKKTKNLQESNEFQVLNSESDLETRSQSQSQLLLQTPANREPTDPVTLPLPPSPSSPVTGQSVLHQTMQDPDFVTQDQIHSHNGPGPGPGPVMGQDAYGSQSQPAMINPIYGSQFPQQPPPQMMGYQPAAASISEFDMIKIAKLVKSMLRDEISEQVKLKVEDETKSLKAELNATKTHLYNTKAELESMRTHVGELHDKVLNLQLKQDDAEQYSRRMCLRISGIPESTNEDVTQKVLDFAKTVNSTISPGDIDRAHRVGAPSSASTSIDGATETKLREIIIKFTNSNARLNLLRGRAVLRINNVKGVFISEDLTPTRKKLAFECRRIKTITRLQNQESLDLCWLPSHSR